jgi:hypothetical protein
MNVEIGRQKIIIIFGNNEAAQLHFWEDINRKQTFILGSHRPFICSAGNIVKNVQGYLVQGQNILSLEEVGEGVKREWHDG